MSVDKNIADSILETYRNMFRELEDKNASGESFDRMKDALNRMESLALETDDVAEFTAKLTTQNLFIEFSNAYSETLSSMLKDEYSKGNGDQILLEKALEAYKYAINQLEGKPNSEKLITPIEELIELGSSGVSYPVFLKIAEEKGLNEALKGSIVVRDSILADLEFAEFMHLPLEAQKNLEILKTFDEMASQSTFGVPDSFEFGLGRQRIEWTYAPKINHWNLMIRFWGKMLENIYDWLDSFCSFAPKDDRWLDMRGHSFTMRNIKRTQECNPGILKSREKIFYEYFQLAWEDIFSQDTFINEYNARRVWYSDETLQLIKKTYDYCKPFNKPDTELIREAEEIYAGKRYKRPDAFQFSTEDKNRFIAMFGEEKYKEMFG